MWPSSGSSKIYSDPPVPPNKHGLWLDCATILWSFTLTHLLVRSPRITQPPIAYVLFCHNGLPWPLQATYLPLHFCCPLNHFRLSCLPPHIPVVYYLYLHFILYSSLDFMLSHTSLNRPPIGAAGADHKIADNIFCVPQVSLNTSR